MLGTIVVARVLNVPESQLVNLFYAQFSFFVIPVTTCMMGTFTSTFCDYLYSSLCWNKVIWELSIPCTMLLLLHLVVFLLHHCSVLYLFVCNYFCFQILDFSKSISFFHVSVTEIYSCKISLPCCCRRLLKALLIYYNMVLGCTRELCSSLK